MATGGRVIIHATVIDIKDDQIIYPSCAQCCSKLQHEEFEKEWYCLKCGISYPESKVSWRFRIALTVADEHSLTDLAIFGSTLEPYFGTTANHFQKYIKKLDDGNLLTEEMLFSSLEETFVGHKFYFGIKSDVNIGELRKLHSLSSPVSVSTITKVKHRLPSAKNNLCDLTAVQIISLTNVSFTHNTVYYNLNKCVKQNTHCSFNAKCKTVKSDNNISDHTFLPLNSVNSTFFPSVVNESLSDSLDFSFEKSVNVGHETTEKENFLPSIRSSGDNVSSYPVKENNQDFVYLSKSTSRCEYDNCDSFLRGVRNINHSNSETKSNTHFLKNFNLRKHGVDEHNFHNFSSLDLLSENSLNLCKNLQYCDSTLDSSSFLCDIRSNITDYESFSVEIMRCDTKTNHSIKISEENSLICDNNYRNESRESQDFQEKSSNNFKFKNEHIGSYNDLNFSEWDCSIDPCEKPTKFERQSHLEEKNLSATEGTETLVSLTKDKGIPTELYDFPESENLDEFLNSYGSDSLRVLEQGHDIQEDTKLIETNYAKSVSKPTFLPLDFYCSPKTMDQHEFLDSFESHLKHSSLVDDKNALDNATPVKNKFIIVNKFSSQLIHTLMQTQESKNCGPFFIAPETTNVQLKNISKSASDSTMYSDSLVDCFRVEQIDNSDRVLTEYPEESELPDSEDLFSSGYLSFNVDEDLDKQSPKPINAYLDCKNEFSSNVKSQKQNHALPPKLMANPEYDNYGDSSLFGDTLNGSIDLFNTSFTEELVDNSIDGIPGTPPISKMHSNNNSVCAPHLIAQERVSNGKSRVENKNMYHVLCESYNCSQNTVQKSKAVPKEDYHELSVFRDIDTEIETPHAMDCSIKEPICSQNKQLSPIFTSRDKDVRFSKRLNMPQYIHLVDRRLNLQQSSSLISCKRPSKTRKMEESDDDIENVSQDLFSPSPVGSSVLPRRNLLESGLVQVSSLDPRIKENHLKNMSAVSTPQAYRSTYTETQSSPDLFSPW